MTGTGNPHRRYALVGPDDSRPPDFVRVARSLSDVELEEEIIAGRGEAGYQLALLAEADRRGKTLPEPTSTERKLQLDADEWGDA